jgi:hypothetical protein
VPHWGNSRSSRSVLAPFHPLFTEWSLLILGAVHVGGDGYFWFLSPIPNRQLFNLCDRVLRVPDAPPASEEMVAPAYTPSWGHFLLHVAHLSYGAHFRHIWPAKIGSRILCAAVARVTALPCFRRRITYRGRYGSRAFRKALGLSSPNMALTFAALHATHQRNSSKAASVGGLFYCSSS